MMRLLMAGMAALAPMSMAAANERDLAETGKLLAEQICARCHAVHARGASPHKDAPPFAELAAKWPLERFEDAFRDGIVAGHPDMPFFAPEEEQIDALVEYIFTLMPEGRAPDDGAE